MPHTVTFDQPNAIAAVHANGDFAAGMRTLAHTATLSDFAAGMRTLPRVVTLGNFATGMHTDSAPVVINMFDSAVRELAMPPEVMVA
jgi:hypothetical protein